MVAAKNRWLCSSLAHFWSENRPKGPASLMRIVRCRAQQRCIRMEGGGCLRFDKVFLFLWWTFVLTMLRVGDRVAPQG